MRMPLCSELVETPLGEHVSCLEYEDERSRSMSDDQVMLYLFEEFGISDGQQLQRLDKEQRNNILSALLSRRAGIRQLQRLTGIGKNIISNISKTILNQSGHWPVPLSSSRTTHAPNSTSNRHLRHLPHHAPRHQPSGHLHR